MEFFGSVLMIIAIGALWILFWKAYYRVPVRHDQTHFARTQDRWRIALSRYLPTQASSSGGATHPVLLCPGLGCNRLAFDQGEDPSLALFLARSGFDVWTLDLRGHGQSDRPNPFLNRHFGWSFDDYVQHDLPTALKKIQELTGKSKVHLVGHSMGGILIYSYLIRHGAQCVASACTVGSSMNYSVSTSAFPKMVGAKKALSFFPAIPLGVMASFYAPFAGRIDNPLDAFNYSAPNADPIHYRRFLANTYHSVSSPVLWQLVSACEKSGLQSADGEFSYYERLSEIKIPILALAGDKDHQCPPKAAQDTQAKLSSSDSKTKIFKGYGHQDLLIGTRAEEEVFPWIANWLRGKKTTSKKSPILVD